MSLVKKKIEYLGIDQPSDLYELSVEILGLKHLIKQAEERIGRLEQASAIMELHKSRIMDGKQTSSSQNESRSKEADSEAQKSSEERGSVSE